VIRTNADFSTAGRVAAGGFKNVRSRWSGWVGSAAAGSVVAEGPDVAVGCVVVSWAEAIVAQVIAKKINHVLPRDII
jgi:hypothetical protein